MSAVPRSALGSTVAEVIVSSYRCGVISNRIYLRESSILFRTGKNLRLSRVLSKRIFESEFSNNNLRLFRSCFRITFLLIRDVTFFATERSPIQTFIESAINFFADPSQLNFSPSHTPSTLLEKLALLAIRFAFKKENKKESIGGRIHACAHRLSR